MTSLKKPSGGIRGIVESDVFRRLVARTLTQQFAKAGEVATGPFQYARVLRAGCECVAHALQSMTELDESATILSVDGVGVFDLVSRNAIMQGLLHMEGGDKLLPFTRQFYSSPSTLLWEDELGITNHIQQGEGGEQGDPLMPLLSALAQHSAFVAISERLQEGEFLFAFEDDLYIKSHPNRTVDCLHITRQELWNHCKISLNHGKTQVWNRGGFFPPGCEALQEAARLDDPGAVVWKGVAAFPTSRS